MLKKLFKIGMLASLIAVACTANAQEEKQYHVFVGVPARRYF